MSGYTQPDHPQNTPAIEAQQSSNADRVADEDRTARCSAFLIEHLLAGARGPSVNPHVPPTKEDMGADSSPNLRTWLMGSAVNAIPTSATATSSAACAISSRHLQQHQHQRPHVHSHIHHRLRNGLAIPNQQQSSNHSFMSSPVPSPAHSGAGECGKSGSIVTLVGTTSNAAGSRKKSRTTFSGRQVFELERHFAVKKYLSSTERAVLAHSLEMYVLYEHSLLMSMYTMCKFSRLCHYV